MRKMIALFLALAMATAVIGCASVGDIAAEPAASFSKPVQDGMGVGYEETLGIEEAGWERVIDWRSDDAAVGGGIPDLYDYCLARMIAEVTRWTDDGCEAMVLVPYEVDYDTDLRQEHYFLQEICRRLNEGDTISVHFADESLIVYDEHYYTAWKHDTPGGEEIPVGSVVSIGVSTLDFDDQVTSDYIAYNGYGNDEAEIETARGDLQEWNTEDRSADRKPLSDLPYAVVRLENWEVTNRRIFSFSCDILKQSDNFTGIPLSSIQQGNIMYSIPEQDIVGFNAPSPDDFPVGTVLKIYYTEDTHQPIYMEPVEWNE